MPEPKQDWPPITAGGLAGLTGGMLAGLTGGMSWITGLP